MEMKEFIRELETSKIYTIYAEDIEYENEDFVIGFIVAIDDSDIVIACVDKEGENNGFLLLDIGDIYRVDFDSSYEKKIETLYHNKKQYHEKFEFSTGEDSLRECFIEWAYDNNKTVTVSFFETDSSVCGLIEKTDPLMIACIDEYGCKPFQGKSCVSLHSAKYLWIDRRQARDAAFVYREQKGMLYNGE